MSLQFNADPWGLQVYAMSHLLSPLAMKPVVRGFLCHFRNQLTKNE